MDNEWYCVRAQPKHDHIAATVLRTLTNLDVFCPRIRYHRITQKQRLWVTEPLFPGYLFVRFDLFEHFNNVRYARGVSTIVHFGEKYPTIPSFIVEGLREKFGAEEVHVIEPPELLPGKQVKITAGAFYGLEAVITQVLPAKDRVKVLLEFLGRQTETELPKSEVVPMGSERQQMVAAQIFNKTVPRV